MSLNDLALTDDEAKKLLQMARLSDFTFNFTVRTGLRYYTAELYLKNIHVRLDVGHDGYLGISHNLHTLYNQQRDWAKSFYEYVDQRKSKSTEDDGLQSCVAKVREAVKGEAR